jgi:photosystem II stability/assembly factor-like uncharacterized protein
VFELAAALALSIGPALQTGPAAAWGDARHAWAAGGGGIVATSKAGVSWRAQARRPVRALAAVDATHAWALSREFTLRTTDGEHWRSLGAQGLDRMTFVDRLHGFAIERLYYFMRTSDGGRTWTAPGGPKGLQSVCFADARTGWVARSGIVWTTHDGGTRWRPHALRRGPLRSPVTELFCHGRDVWAVLHGGAAAGTEGYRIFSSRDGGRAWRALFASFSTTLPLVSNYSGPVAALGGGGAVLEGSCAPCGAGSVTFVRMPGRSRTVLRSTLPGPVAFATRALGLAVLRPAPRGVPGIYRTTDGGRTWRRVFASTLLEP